MFSAKFITSASVIAASLLSSVGVASAAGFSTNGGVNTYTDPATGQVYTVGGFFGKFNNGVTSGMMHAFGGTGSGSKAFAYGKTNCTNGVNCVHNGSGQGRKGTTWNTTATAVNNNNGTWTVNGTLNYTKPGMTLQTKTKTWTFMRDM